MNPADPAALDSASPQRLARLLGLGVGTPWGSADLPDLWRIELQAPLAFNLPGAAPSSRPLDAAVPTLHALLHHPHPPLPLLERAKDWAKAWRAQPELPLPDELGAAVYFLAILLAKARHGARISSLDDAGLQSGAAWLQGQAWLDADTRRLADMLAASL